MRAQHAGTIVNISSIGGQLYSPLGGWYYASKHALEALSDSLRLEVASFGIDVIIIEPGGTNTEWASVMADKLCAATPANSAYKKMAATFGMPMSGQMGNFTTVADIAKLIYKAITARHPATRYQPRRQEKLMVLATRKLSYRQFDRIAMHTVNTLLKKE